MSNATIIFLLTLCIMILICIIVYQQFVFHNGTKAKIHEISSKLKELLDTDSDEKVTVFTDNKALIELATQINRMLEDRQKVKVEYRRAEMASKKMFLYRAVYKHGFSGVYQCHVVHIHCERL